MERTEEKPERPRATRFLDEEDWRRRCGCLRTSDKLRQILERFPPPPPPTPEPGGAGSPCQLGSTCISAYCTRVHRTAPGDCEQRPLTAARESFEESEPDKPHKKAGARPWRAVAELVQLLQLSVTATALALYYLIYCYMQLVYYTLRSALYFHHADGAMKITIAVVMVTSLVLAFNLILKMERLIGVFS